VAPAGDFEELGFLREWLDRGYAGNMSWMSRTARRRAGVQHVVEGARSVVVTGTLYNTDRPYSDVPSRGVGLVSRYAWGDDYHDVIGARLDALLAWMREAAGEPFDARAYVDTGPVQERVYAQYAGLGWIGKNTCLINPEIGSWLFLGEIITTLPLDPDAQGLEQCGGCTKCLEACPTGALVDAGVLDATRCLSYLTIELRSAIPDEHRASLDRHVYGCDVCQEVCPYNLPAPASADPAWQARPGLDLPRLVDLWRLPDAGLQSLVHGGAMTRAALTGLRRNLAVAIGNSGDPDALAALREPAGDRPSIDDPLLRALVDWALGRTGAGDARLSGPAGH
jgi:epoxyqueuosine reductase